MTKQNKPLILIVDDTPTNIQVLAENLIQDYRVKVANSGEAAFETINRHGVPDLILLDVMMPEMDGYEVCRRLKKAPETADVPVIFITAMSGILDEAVGLDLGAMDYIIKPFFMPVVKARIRNHVRLKQVTDMLESMVWLDNQSGVANRRRFEQILDNEWKRGQRGNSSLALVIIHLNYFKAYIEHYGHDKADECLQRVATCLCSGVRRPADLVARYADEEFAVLMPDTNMAGALRISENLSEKIAAECIPHAGINQSEFLSISIGYSVAIPDPAQLSVTLMDDAYHALLRNMKSNDHCTKACAQQFMSAISVRQ